MDFSPPTASEEHQEQDPSSAVQDPVWRGRDPSHRGRISIRPATPPPPWLQQLFQKVPVIPVSNSQGPPPLQKSSQPSADNRRSPQPPSDQSIQPGATTACLAKEARIVYKSQQQAEEKEVSKLLSSQSQSSSSIQAAVRPPHSTSIKHSSTFKEFDETEEFEEFDEFSSEWRSRELRREAELRREVVLKIGSEASDEECKDCNARSIQVRFRPRNWYFVVTLFPCEPQMVEEFEYSDYESD